MLPTIEQLLVLQDRDRKIQSSQAELAAIEPQRQASQARLTDHRQAHETVRLKLRHLEAERKKLETEAQSLQEKIAKYSLQQFQTKKNDEYRALTHEIEFCHSEIVKLEDQQLAIMEEAETTQAAAHKAAQAEDNEQRETDRQLQALAEREANLNQHLASLTEGRVAIAAVVPADLLLRYERLRRSKGDRVIASVEHSACGGCHMKLPAHIVLACRAEQELTSCPNCGRILFYTNDMDLSIAE